MNDFSYPTDLKTASAAPSPVERRTRPTDAYTDLVQQATSTMAKHQTYG
jgi:hypothetical protein